MTFFFASFLGGCIYLGSLPSPCYALASSSSNAADLIAELAQRQVVPVSDPVFRDTFPDLAAALSSKKNVTVQEIWEFYENLAQSRVPKRSYAETFGIKLKQKCWLFPKYVDKKQQGVINSINGPNPSETSMY